MNIKTLLTVLTVVGAATSLNAYSAAPVAVNDTRAIALNSVATINVLANDFDADGDTLTVVNVTGSANATVSINNDGSINYIPNNGFSGIDQFSYTIEESNADALTSTATVTITVVSQDTVDAVIGSRQQNIGAAFDILCTRLRATSDAELGAVRRNLLERCNAVTEVAQNNPERVPEILRQISPDEVAAITRIARQSGRALAFAVRQRLDQRRAGVQGFTFNGLPASDYDQKTGGAAGSDTLVKRLGFFASAQVGKVDKETSDQEIGYDSDSSAFTVGFDYRLNKHVIFGSAFSIASGELSFSNSGGELQNDEQSLLVFGSYTYGNFSYDAQLGFASTEFSTERLVSYNESNGSFSDTLVGETHGDQILFNNLVQWAWNKGAYSAYPFLKLDYTSSEIAGYSEQGNSGLPMTISGQQSQQFVVGLGVQNTYAVGFNWGVWVPSLELSLNSELSDGMDSAEARFAFDTDASNTFVIDNDGGDSAFWQIGLASSFAFQRGTSAFFQYQHLAGYEGLSAYQVSGGLRLEF